MLFCNLPQNQNENCTCIQVDLKSGYQANLEYKFRAIRNKGNDLHKKSFPNSLQLFRYVFCLTV